MQNFNTKKKMFVTWHEFLIAIAHPLLFWRELTRIRMPFIIPCDLGKKLDIFEVKSFTSRITPAQRNSS